jgi:hypothetical protein
VVAVAAAAAIVVVVASGGKPKTVNNAQLVRRVVAGYWNASGSAECNYLSPRELSFEYGGLAGCRKATANFLPSPISGQQHIQVIGTNATDSAIVSGHPWKLTLVKQNGKWLIDSRDNKDSDAIQRLATAWTGARGSSICNLYSQANLNANYGGSLARCQAAYKTEAPGSVTGTQNISFQSATRATDYFKENFQGRTESLKMLAAKQSNGSWLINLITKA